MADTSRVAVYIDFDNMVISRYDDLHGQGAWREDNARHHQIRPDSHDEVDQRLTEAEVDLGAIIDYASSFGTVALTRAYADWSVPANAAYKRQVIDRAVDLVQLFSVSGTKNGADIRLSIDAVADLTQHADITHVVIVGGDSDYIPLAQSCKRMGRFVIGIGVAGSISRALVAAVRRVQFVRRPPVGERSSPDPQDRGGEEGRPSRCQEDREQEGGTHRRRAGHGAVHPRDPGGVGEERRRLGALVERQEPDAANGLDLQGEVAGILVVPGLRGVARGDPRDTCARQRPGGDPVAVSRFRVVGGVV